MSGPDASILEGQVCAVVVTYNRKELLRECVQALLAQHHAVSLIWIFNNVSTDGTLEMLAHEFPAREFPQVRVTTLEKNSGGAGGFHEGVKQATGAGFEWLWLMDDDTIAEPGALAEMFAARSRFPAGQRPDLLSSKVVWTDGSLHPMNISWFDQRDPEFRFLAASCGTFPLRTATFVSMLFHRRHVEKYGLPLADYFVWADDVEYSARILRENPGVAVPQSVVLHKTPRKHGSLDPGERFYYHVRNGMWMLRRSAAFSGREKTKLWGGFCLSLAKHLKACRYSGESFARIFRGLRDGVFKAPLK